ncbi:MAG: hypothetical protein RDU89_08465 [bacterium]|nr:hypothetical protein [bacterium]
MVVILIILAGAALLGWRQFSGREQPAPEPGFAEALAAYREAIRTNAPGRVQDIPDGTIVHPVTDESVPFRENAAHFFAVSRGRAVTGVSTVGNVFAALESPAAGEAVGTPLMLVIWHNTNHYTGVGLTLVDDQGATLAEVGLPEISHWNILLQRQELELEYEQPDAAGGSVRVYALGIYEGEGSQLLFEVPVVFGNNR